MLLAFQFRLDFETGVFVSSFLGRLRLCFFTSQTLLRLFRHGSFCHWHVYLTCYWLLLFRHESEQAFSSLPQDVFAHVSAF